MAHFAELDEQGTVTQVIVVDNDKIRDEQGRESEAAGAAFCQSLCRRQTRWMQTSYNANFRKNYAGIGYTYVPEKDAFVEPRPYLSWVLDEETCRWGPPTPYPADGEPYLWSEDTGAWVLAEPLSQEHEGQSR